MVQQTSLEAYKAILPTLSKKQEIVFYAIENNPGVSNHDIARILKWEINCVTPRVNELRDKCMVSYCGDKVDRVTGRSVMKWECIENYISE